MTAHSFVDESKHHTFLLVAVLVKPAQLVKTRQVIAGMVLPRQRRIHFYKERDDRRAMLMKRLAELPLEAVVFEAARTDKTARDTCLGALVDDHLARGVHRLVIERDDSRVESDRRLLRQRIQSAGLYGTIRYEHLRAFEEPLLAIPDAIAWCWTHGGHWRVKAKGLVTDVVQA